MTREDVAKLIRMNFTLYKLGAKPLTDEEMETTIDVWAFQFRNYSGDAVKKAFLAANKVCKYPICVADIFEQLPKEDMADNWRKLKTAIGKVEYYMGWRACPMILGIDGNGKPIKSSGTDEINAVFEGLPQTVKNWLGSSSELVNLSRYSEDELDRYRRPEFMKVPPEPIGGLQERGRLADGNHIAGITGNLPESCAGVPARR